MLKICANELTSLGIVFCMLTMYDKCDNKAYLVLITVAL